MSFFPQDRILPLGQIFFNKHRTKPSIYPRSLQIPSCFLESQTSMLPEWLPLWQIQKPLFCFFYLIFLTRIYFIRTYSLYRGNSLWKFRITLHCTLVRLPTKHNRLLTSLSGPTIKWTTQFWPYCGVHTVLHKGIRLPDFYIPFKGLEVYTIFPNNPVS
jgi:hypothetical protein